MLPPEALKSLMLRASSDLSKPIDQLFPRRRRSGNRAKSDLHVRAKSGKRQECADSGLAEVGFNLDTPTNRHASFCVPLFCAVTGWTWVNELLKHIAPRGSFNAYRVRLGQNMV
jgi:hypothetical protein